MTARTKDLFGEDAKRDVEELRDKVLNAVVWQSGVALLRQHGSNDADARAFLGRRMKEIGRDALARGIIAAFIANVESARPYLAAVKGLPPIEPSYGASDDDDDPMGVAPFFEDETGGGD